MSEYVDMDETVTTAIPHDRASEEAVLGSVLINPMGIYALAFLKADDFFIHRNKWIWEIFQKFTETRTPIDILTVQTELERSGKLGEVGGAAYLTSLINQTPDSTNAEAYARSVQDMAIRRSLLAEANNLASSALNYSKPVNSTVSATKDSLDVLGGVLEVGSGFQPVGQVLSGVYDRIVERAQNPTKIWGIPTGLKKLDEETGGQHAGELTFLAGEPGVKKTFLALQIAMYASKFVPTAMASMELRESSIGMRIISGTSGVSSKSMRSGFVDSDDWPKITQAIEESDGLPLYLSYDTYTTQSLSLMVRKARNDFGIGLLIIDYAMLFLDEGKDENERTGLISRRLKAIANKGIAVICVHSVTKVGMDQTANQSPLKSYMRGSGQMIHDADNIFFLTEYMKSDDRDGFLKEEETKKMRTLHCKKGREMEDASFVEHLVQRGGSPFLDEYDRYSAQMAKSTGDPRWLQRADVGGL